MSQDHIFYGAARLELHIPLSRSLKERRSVVRSLKDRLAERGRIAVIETGSQEFHQRATLGICTVARDESQLRASFAAVQRVIESEDRVVLLLFQTRIGSLEDEPGEMES